MLYVISCLVTYHNPAFVIVAAGLCILGSVLTARLLSRAIRATGPEKAVWLGLTGFVGGAVIWTTHFMAMLGYENGGAAAYEPSLTLFSLLIAVLSSFAGLAIAAYGERTMLVEAGGAIVGLGISGMHFVGMAAYKVSGTIIWDNRYVAASVLMAVLFGALTTNRIIRPVTRFCRYGGAAALVLGITSAHFTGMAGIDIVLAPVQTVASDMLSPIILGFSVLGIMLVLLGLAACTYLLDAKTNRAAVDRYRHLSLHDPLTGLPNRTAFLEELAALQAGENGQPGNVAILSFDLNRFKEINDVHGHAAGDAVLQAIGERLASVSRPNEFLARIGGDEFVAISRHYFARQDALQVAHRIVNEIGRPIEWNAERFTVSSSVGIAIFDYDGSSVDDVVTQADVAMYRAKATAPNTICFYDPSMDQAVRERNALAIDMRSSLQNNEFELFYQVQNEAATGRPIGFEALLRWNHPVRGRISPAEFIPIAERTGLINEIGEWVLRNACREAAGWTNALGIAVNVAAQQLADLTFPAKVKSILTETGLDAQRLELEITESGIIEDQRRALVVLKQLKEIGVKIAMDDYGTGYSSLSTLMNFPFDKIKIDRSFVEHVATDSLSAAIVRSTLILAQSLNIPVLAEGVEGQDQIDFLKREGCLQVQGYLFGKPVPLSAIRPLIDVPAWAAEEAGPLGQVA
ncbi:putative bifunctional diguanylate cyclase/phosphodiesterase [Rhizobium oryzicola]|uniref:EAL domain-containing protein n=1 Tax=Rhizobium oryzicola TaxID=1232668 RepID=A0ABT8SW18_9HYPH|nr:bifunctional diguanylate cyclase/phosphodiesterase [Rhizobium oryzicola]MDO1582334.1 EAL domain-containing protein [Rhizobium oryzicola]